MIGEGGHWDCGAQDRVHGKQSKETFCRPLALHLYQHLGLCVLPSHLNSNSSFHLEQRQTFLLLSRPGASIGVLDPFPFACIFLLFHIISFLLSDGSFWLVHWHVVIALKTTKKFLRVLILLLLATTLLLCSPLQEYFLYWVFSSLILHPTFSLKPIPVRICPCDYTKAVLIKITVTSTLLNLSLHFIWPFSSIWQSWSFLFDTLHQTSRLHSLLPTMLDCTFPIFSELHTSVSNCLLNTST